MWSTLDRRVAGAPRPAPSAVFVCCHGSRLRRAGDGSHIYPGARHRSVAAKVCLGHDDFEEKYDFGDQTALLSYLCLRKINGIHLIIKSRSGV